MSRFKITAKEPHGDMPRGTTLYVDTPLSSCDADKIEEAIEDAGYNQNAQDASWPGYWKIEKIG